MRAGVQEALAGGSAEHLRLSHAARETGELLERARGHVRRLTAAAAIAGGVHAVAGHGPDEPPQGFTGSSLRG